MSEEVGALVWCKGWLSGAQCTQQSSPCQCLHWHKCEVPTECFVYITGRRLAELDKAVSEIGRNVTAIQAMS